MLQGSLGFIERLLIGHQLIANVFFLERNAGQLFFEGL